MSVDSGNSWEEIFSGYVDSIAVNSKNPDHMYVAGEKKVNSHNAFSIAWTKNGGKKWTHKTFSPGFRGNASTIAIHPTNPKIIIVGGHVNYKPVLVKSTNGGKSLKQIGKNDIKDIYWPYISSIAFDPSSPSTIYAGTPAGLYKSTNNGVKWTKVCTDYVTCILVNPANPTEIYIGTSQGVFCSHDRGATWIEYNKGMSVAYTTCMIMNNSTNDLFCGTEGGSVFTNKRMTSSHLTILSSTGGTTSPAPSDYTYGEGTQIEITAKPFPGYKFFGWSHDGHGEKNTIKITVNKDKVIKANFIPEKK